MLKISDPTLRDGNHAVRHQLNEIQIGSYAALADKAGLYCIEVGHGNGLGASSCQVGRSCISDRAMLRAARENLRNTKLGVHIIPGFATVQKDIIPALEDGVDLFRIGAHCTEADVTQTHIEYLRNREIEVYGVLMMSHMASKESLRSSALLVEKYGAQGVIIMDSAGAYTPSEVEERVGFLVEALTIEVGFHAHNNLGLAIANTLAAAKSGATILDATARGFGAGAGNCQLELLVPLLKKMGNSVPCDEYALFEAAEFAERELVEELPFSKTMSIVTGLAGVFSGFSKHIMKAATAYSVDPKDIAFELGRRKVVAGQEDMIIEVAEELSKKTCALLV